MTDRYLLMLWATGPLLCQLPLKPTKNNPPCLSVSVSLLKSTSSPSSSAIGQSPLLPPTYSLHRIRIALPARNLRRHSPINLAGAMDAGYLGLSRRRPLYLAPHYSWNPNLLPLRLLVVLLHLLPQAQRLHEIPTKKAMLLQIYVAMKAMPWYCALPTFSEYMVENGWTKCYSRVSDVGWLAYLVYMPIYLVLVEFGIYWMHRELHDIKPLYKYLHATHHIYNKQNTLSPFAGLAFHPLDGILQAVPHVVALFLVPTHFTTHIALLFLEAIWTANIHDCIHGKLWPVMGAGYHTIHHTTYRHNYGHYTIWMDWMFGTLRDPIDDESKKVM
ncbi:uncharacterized protein J3R85_008286 [Psidium guajava]|nr:uncharacterized protein J3R85_008286 [Psidium guajava]